VRGAHERGGVGHRGDLREALQDPLDRGGVDVGDQDVGAVLDQVADQVGADLARAGHRHGAPGQRR
jgi:hypothetical protein